MNLLLRNSSLLKEQRVDGSWQLLSGVDNTCLRFTLTGYESNSPKEDGLFIEQLVSLINHQIKFLSNQIDMCRKYNTIIFRKPINLLVSRSKKKLNYYYNLIFLNSEETSSPELVPSPPYLKREGEEPCPSGETSPAPPLGGVVWILDF